MRNVALCLVLVLGFMLPVEATHAQRMPAPVAVSLRDAVQRSTVADGLAPVIRPATNGSVDPDAHAYITGLLTAAILPLIVIGVVAAVVGNANR